MTKFQAHGFRTLATSEVRVQLFDGDPDKQGTRQLAVMTESETRALIQALTAALDQAFAEDAE